MNMFHCLWCYTGFLYQYNADYVIIWTWKHCILYITIIDQACTELSRNKNIIDTAFLNSQLLLKFNLPFISVWKLAVEHVTHNQSINNMQFTFTYLILATVYTLRYIINTCTK